MMSEGIENRPSVCPKTMTSNVVEEYCASPKPLKPRYGDRFIPSRVGNTWDLTFENTLEALEVRPKTTPSRPSFLLNTREDRQPRPKSETLKPSNERLSYRTALRNEIFGESFNDLEGMKRSSEAKPVRRRLFNCDNAARSEVCSNGSIYSTSPVSTSTESLLDRSRSIRKRKIPTVPYKFPPSVKILDAPGIEDDFYFNILHVSSQNCLVVCLGYNIYTMQNCNGNVQHLTDEMWEQDQARISKPTSIAWNPKGDILAVGRNDGAVQIWDVKSSKIQRAYRAHEGRVTSLAWNGDDLLTSSSLDCTIVQNDIRSIYTGNHTRRRGHMGEVCKVTWSLDGINLASGDATGRVFIWDIRGSDPLLQCSEHTAAAVKALDWSPHVSHLLASGGGEHDKTLRIWNILKGSRSIHQFDMKAQICNVLWSRFDEELVVSLGFNSGKLVVLKYDHSKHIQQLASMKAHSERVLYMAMVANGEGVITAAAADETVKFWNLFRKKKPDKSLRRSIFNDCIR